MQYRVYCKLYSGFRFGYIKYATHAMSNIVFSVFRICYRIPLTAPMLVYLYTSLCGLCVCMRKVCVHVCVRMNTSDTDIYVHSTDMSVFNVNTLFLLISHWFNLWVKFIRIICFIWMNRFFDVNTLEISKLF